jgi:hypothetical protein
MGMPPGIGIVETLIGFPHQGDAAYDFTDMPHVPFKDEVWPKFLSQNARRILKIGQ